MSISANTTSSRDRGGGAQFTLRTLLYLLSAFCLFLGLASWDALNGTVLFFFLIGTLLVSAGIGRWSVATIMAGVILIWFSVAFFYGDAIGAGPLLTIATAVGIMLSFANVPENAHEKLLLLGTLLACGILGAMLYWERVIDPFVVFRTKHFLMYLCGGLTAGIIITTPYVLIRIVLTRAAVRRSPQS
jgi:hypothetical protein